jgi:hypothetical protein
VQEPNRPELLEGPHNQTTRTLTAASATTVRGGGPLARFAVEHGFTTKTRVDAVATIEEADVLWHLEVVVAAAAFDVVVAPTAESQFQRPSPISVSSPPPPSTL